jgi:hypothetical protein
VSAPVDEFTEAAARETFDDGERKCPYCSHGYQPEPCDYGEQWREEECERCGKSYHAHDSCTVTHYATPDCELNGDPHDWQDRAVGGGRLHPFCMKCDKCMPMSMRASTAAQPKEQQP